MSLSRATFAIRRAAIRAPAPMSYTPVRLSHSGYGSGGGDPKGDNPKDQGASQSADKEHPGPPPPKAGEGSGSGPTKGSADGHNTSKSNKREFSTMARRMAEGRELRSEKTKDAEPKIHNESAPSGDEVSADVKKHNEEMENRAEKAHERSPEDEGKDKVDKDFWSGNGGRDDKS